MLRDRWAYSDKIGPDGRIERFKARLTAMGCFQRPGVDYTETYASVMTTCTFRMMLQLYNSDAGNSMLHWDVSTAFIHAPLEERVYMKQASGHEVPGKETWVYLLVKALYGTKQAARAWQLHLRKLLVQAGCKSMQADPETYTCRRGGGYLIIGTHVDDLFVLFNPEGKHLKDMVWQHLTKHLTIKDLGEATWTLQMSIKRDEAEPSNSQETFTLEVLRRFNMNACKPAPTPAVDAGDESTMRESDCPTTPDAQREIADLPFLELIGCLWWLVQMTRPDVFVALQQASKWVAKPSAKLWRWLVRILKYLAGTTSMGIIFRRHSGAAPLQAYFDAAFADTDDSKSTAGWIAHSHGALIAYDSTTIKRVVSSSTEAECNAMAIVAKENTWHRRLYTEMRGVDKLPPTPIFGDNTASIMMLDLGVTKRNRHFAIEWHLVRERVDDGELKVEWLPTEANLADFFTKKLPRARFVALRNQIMDAGEPAVIINCVHCDDEGCDGSPLSYCYGRELNMGRSYMGTARGTRLCQHGAH